jgi:Tol biopolymer transport system component
MGRLLTIGLLVAGLLGVVNPTRAQEATPAAGTQLIDFDGGGGEGEAGGRRIISMSPDGAALAVWDQSGDADQLCIVEVATLRDRVCGDLSPLDAGLRDADVVWSPDSSKLAFGENSFIYLIDGDLWVMDAQSGELTNIADDGYSGDFPFGEDTAEPFSFDILPAWRPDGEAIAYSSSPHDGDDFGGNRIVETKLDGSSPETLLTVSTDQPGVVYYGMLFSKDGSHLLFTVSHTDRDNPQNGLWTANGDGSNPRQVLGNDEELGTPVVVDVTPSGDRALVFYAEAAMQYRNRGSVYAIVDTTSGDREPLEVDLQDQPDEAFISLATFSPDGTKLLTVTRLTDPEGIVEVRDLESGDVEQIGEPIEDAGMAIVGRGPIWATNSTVFIPRGPFAGAIITVEGGLDVVVTPEPVTATPEPSTPEAGAFAPGQTVVTNDANVSMRSAPSTSAMVVLELEQGTEVTVAGPAVEGDGFVWLPVIEPESQTVGYIREEFLSPT